MKQNLFGTDGIRARIGTHPFTLETLPILGRAIGQWALEKYGTSPRMLIAHDTRNSCHWVKTALQNGLLLQNISIEDASILPTPAVLRLLKNNTTFHAGIIISASHNPYYDNGIKLCDATAGKISGHDELRISEIFISLTSITAAYELCGLSTHLPQAQESYIDSVTQHFDTSLCAGKKIVLDCAHGATSKVAPAIFKKLGATVIVINDAPNGFNINEGCGALHLDMLKDAIQEHSADIGFAFDGDGDRVMAVNNKGQVRTGDDIIALLAQHPTYATAPTIVGTVMTNQGLETYLQEKNISLVRTPVGDKYIADYLEKHNLLLGGEQSGHIILRDYLNTGDGIFAALRLLETLTLTNNWTMETFTKFPQVLINLKVASRKDLHISPVAEIIAESQHQVSPGRVLVRYSGTEPLLRIMAEAQDQQTAHDIAYHLSVRLASILS